METAFIQAAKEKRSLQLRNLLLDGVNPDVRDGFGETALTWAARLGHTPIVKDLLAAGADVEVVGQLFKAPPIVLAARGGYRGIVRLLAVHANLDAQDSLGTTALMRALEQPENRIKPLRKISSILAVLLDNGADPDVQDSAGETALMRAVRGGNREAVRMLAERGCRMDLENGNGETALQLADQQGDVEMVALLHQLGAEK